MGKIIFYSLPRPQWERAGARVKLGCLLFIAGLCFGQFIEPGMSQKLPQPISPGWGMMQSSDWNNSMIRKISFCQNPLQFNTMLMMQVEGESLQPKTSFLKQAGIYGLEFVGASIGSGIPSMLGLVIAMYNTIDNPWSPGEGYKIYVIGNILLSSTSCWFVGKLCNQNKCWWKSAIGTAIGSGIGVLALDKWIKKEGERFYPEGIVIFGLPPLCATIGLNL
ncbi:MAG: hypothetical protein ABIL20_08355 [candidate division WOR-3 bacterium]